MNKIIIIIPEFGQSDINVANSEHIIVRDFIFGNDYMEIMELINDA